MQDNKDKKSSFSSALKKAISMPSDALLGEVRIEMRGKNVLMVNGCRKILKYSTEEIDLRLKGFCLCVRGHGLQCTAYHYGSVSVEGDICCLSFDKEE